MPPAVVSQQRQRTGHSLPNTDPRLGFMRPTTSHEVRSQLPPTPAMPIQSPPILTSSFVQAPPFGSATQPIPIPSPLRIYPLIPAPSETTPNHDLGDSEFEDSESDGQQAGGLDIDEQSDGEDERVAHQLLSAAPVEVRAVTSTPLVEMRAGASNPSVLSYNHAGFSVSSYLCLMLCLTPSPNRRLGATTRSFRTTTHGTELRRPQSHHAFVVFHLRASQQYQRHQYLETQMTTVHSAHTHPSGRKSLAMRNGCLGRTLPVQMVSPGQLNV